MDKVFFKDKEQDWEIVGNGISRKITGYNESIMMVKVAFKKDAVGALHSHIHTQTTFVSEGEFEVIIGGEKKILAKGDCFFTPSNIEHGVTCLEEGELIDVFSPVREDFLK